MQNNKGFTLVEVILSIVLIGIIATSGFEIFRVSQKTEKTVFNIDKANTIATSKIEEIKSDPFKFYYQNAINEETYLDKYKKKITGEVEKNSEAYKKNIYYIVNNAVATEYYNKNWELQKNSTNAAYEMKMEITREKSTRRMNGYNVETPYMEEDDYTIPADGSEYFITITRNPYKGKWLDKKYLQNDYLIVLLKKYNYEDFKYEYRGSEDDEIQLQSFLTNKVANHLKPEGSDTNGNNYNRSVFVDKSRPNDSIPIRVDFSTLAKLSKYKIEVMNLIDKDVDLYLFYDEENDNQVDVDVIKGNVNITRTSRRQRLENTNYKITVTLIRKKDNKEILKFKNEKYIPNEKMKD